MKWSTLLFTLAAATVPPQVPSVHYRIVYEPGGSDTDWHVTVDASGMRAPGGRGGKVTLRLEDWGEWTQVDSYYLRSLAGDPPVRRVEGARNEWELDPPADWNGAFHLEYAIATSELFSNANRTHGILPYRAKTYCLGFTANTLVSVAIDGAEIELGRRVTIEAPQGWTIATGFGGISADRQEAEIPAGFDNGVLSLGVPLATTVLGTGSPPIEIVQWGGSEDVTKELARFARTFVDACTAGIGTPPTGTIRLLVTEPGHGGTRTDGSIALGCPDLSGERIDPYTIHFLAHEIFHDWLGGRLEGPGESMAWFWEGFTEYFSLYYATKAGLVAREWFPRRLLDYEEAMAANVHWGELAFADQSVNWRDPAFEPLAYHGSALVAFALDIALREDGREGLVELLRGLLELPGGRYDLAAIRTWLEENGQETFWSEHLARAVPPDLHASLAAIGVSVSNVEGGTGDIEIDPPGIEAFLR